MARAKDGTSDAEGGEGGGAGLSRELGGPMLAVYGTGTILGAGIFVLIGKVAGTAGFWTPVAFLVAALVASVNGMVYAELATRHPGAGGPAAYADEAFGRRGLTVLLGWMIVATGIVSAATITTGFSGYLTHFWDVPEWIPRTLLLLGLAGVAGAGAKESAWFMAVTTTLGVLGLFYVVWVGFVGVEGSTVRFVGELGSLTRLPVLTGLLSASFLAVYAFIGFEDMVHMAEEVERPSRAMPGAIAFAVGVAAVFYVGVSIAALNVLDPAQLEASQAPLVEVVEEAGYPGTPLTLLSLAIILNGALAQIVMATRVIYSLGGSGGAPDWLARVSETTDTPLRATLLAAGLALVLALFLPLKTLAAATSVIILLVFASSNASLIRLERVQPEAPFDLPRAAPWVGLVLSLLLVAASPLLGGGGH